MSGRREAFPLRPWVERTWCGDARFLAALLLGPLAAVYRAGSALSRVRAARARRPMRGMTVIAIGGLTVGGAGKTTLARWAARAALDTGRRPAILLRGHGAEAAGRAPQVVPIDAPSTPGAVRRYGDESLAHRAALPASVLVVTGKDRRKAARLALEAGADLAILDDGWEQGTLAWDFLWVVVDPLRPFGNGRLLPAGPLRRPAGNLRQATVIVEIAEAKGEESAGANRLLDVASRALPRVRFSRRVEGWIRSGGSGDAVGAPTPPAGPRLLISSVGSPERLERFLTGAGAAPDDHVAFPDHAAWDHLLVARRAAALAAKTGLAPVLVVTDKDAARAALLPAVGLEVWIVRSGLEPLDDVSPLLAGLRLGASGTVVAARPPIG